MTRMVIAYTHTYTWSDENGEQLEEAREIGGTRDEVECASAAEAAGYMSGELGIGGRDCASALNGDEWPGPATWFRGEPRADHRTGNIEEVSAHLTGEWTDPERRASS
jgi:hypothetical protein